jgi:hypothetical protein
VSYPEKVQTANSRDHQFVGKGELFSMKLNSSAGWSARNLFD